jgi:hypothetical protein
LCRFDADLCIPLSSRLHRRFATLDEFYKGPEALIGIPNPLIREGMYREHCLRDNATTRFITNNYNITTTSSTEWEFVVCPTMTPPNHYEHTPRDRTLWRPGNEWAGDHGRDPVPLAELMTQRDVEFWVQRSGLTEDEVIGLRLYTGRIQSCRELANICPLAELRASGHTAQKRTSTACQISLVFQESLSLSQDL